MGLLVDGLWCDQWYDTKKSGGHFLREDAQFRHQIGGDSYPVEEGRYHLYISHACPWAHRTAIVRHLKDLEGFIPVTAVSPDMLSDGWVYDSPEPNYGYQFHHQLYTHSERNYTGRVTVPVLWDLKTETIVNNESSEIIRLFNSAFNIKTGNHIDLYPEHLRSDINRWNDLIYPSINNGVYRCGFATTQQAYEEAFTPLFTALNTIEEQLSVTPYLTGEYLTEADIRLFTTLIRFDPVYVGHFKCNLKRIADYPNLWDYTKAIYQFKGISNTVHFDEIKRHYYFSHANINPTQVIPAGPDLSALNSQLNRPAPKLFQA
ncbi:glutathione S-transferase family protein [Oceanospirillum linum]|uniref:Glutathione-dependent reductase n=1 Tax=Oceanospirillum linum TaxID=966 RepID=A0A1T1H9S2_OCELI|nr:glutathione S-transferase family protein [Oceanospirillum linum]OOV86588.1 glutathione-dependent reductase [Oceanospirillum linum]SEG29098.1 putative glutathione S-transferase [Oleiphilus messinensis]SMP26613.1 putative glutathione S-transferase [Oceanospirillum linum]